MGVNWVSAAIGENYAGTPVSRSEITHNLMGGGFNQVRAQSSGPVEPQEFRAVAFAEIRMLELAAEFHLEFAIQDPLVGHAAPAVLRAFSETDGGSGLSSVCRQPLEKVQLGHRLVVHCVVNFAGAAFFSAAMMQPTTSSR
jgi:hypothetical protein